MSADNGVYILKTPRLMCEEDKEFEYRVADCMAIDNLTYRDPNGDEEIMSDLFGDCLAWQTEEGALHEAYRIYKEIMNGDFPVCEYGIQMISLPKKFPSKPSNLKTGLEQCKNREFVEPPDMNEARELASIMDGECMDGMCEDCEDFITFLHIEGTGFCFTKKMFLEAHTPEQFKSFSKFMSGQTVSSTPDGEILYYADDYKRWLESSIIDLEFQ